MQDNIMMAEINLELNALHKQSSTIDFFQDKSIYWPTDVIVKTPTVGQWLAAKATNVGSGFDKGTTWDILKEEYNEDVAKIQAIHEQIDWDAVAVEDYLQDFSEIQWIKVDNGDTSFEHAFGTEKQSTIRVISATWRDIELTDYMLQEDLVEIYFSQQ